MNRTLFFATALYLLFVIYGSLVPLAFNNLPVETAVSQFKAIRYLNLGAGSRADWIANIVLYIPLAFGLSATFGGIRHPLARALIAIIILVFCLALAVAVEFTQLFFPPRTVSINDLIAEALGSVIGILVWQFFGG
jgi:VanZ family protein